VLSGAGTAGAYHAGVLRALHEAGVKIDIVAGVGMGVASALFAAVDGGARLWEQDGLWRGHAALRMYRWRRTLHVGLAALAIALGVLVLPLSLFLVAVLVYPAAFLLEVLGLSVGPDLVAGYGRLLASAFAPEAIPTILPRILVLALLVLLVMLAAGLVQAARAGARRRERGPVWWRAFGAPIVAEDVTARFADALWSLIRGTTLRRSSLEDLSQSYTELLRENLGQPGFRELLVTAHDLDARRDLIFALLTEPHRQAFFARRAGPEGDRRQSEILDLAGVGGRHLGDALAGGVTVPVGAEPHLIEFAADGYWRGETHRLCSRPDALGRVIDELMVAGAEQVLLVSASAELSGAHTLGAGRRDPRGRLGEYLNASEAAALRGATVTRARRLRGGYVIRPAHNPLGPFDFRGAYDDRSDRDIPLSELVECGYQDAYRQFVDPVIGAGGDRLHQTTREEEGARKTPRPVDGPTP
jgi:hypothetical protein